MKKSLFLLLFQFFLLVTLSAQSFEWAQKAGGTDNDRAAGMASDNAGNSYVVVAFANSITIGNQTFSSSAGNVLLSKYNPSGLAEWAIQLNSMTIKQVIATNSNVYIAGEYRSTGTIGSISLAGDAYGEAFFSKLDVNGNIVFTKTGGGLGYDCFSGIALDQSENIYLTGKFDSAATFNSTVLMGRGENNFFVIKYTSSGTVVWGHVPDKNGDFATTAQKIITDSPGSNVYALGHVDSEGTDSVRFGTIQYAPNQPGSNFIVHYDGITGNPQHVIETSFGSKVVEKDITLDNSGNVYLITDYTDFPFRISKHDIQLNPVWQLTDGGDQVNAGDIKITPAGDIYVGGSFYGQGEFKADTIVSGPVTNGFLAKYDPSGASLWVKSIIGSDNTVMELGLDALNNIYVAGFFTGTVYFDGIIVSGSGGEDMFIAKLNTAVLSVAELQNSIFQLYPNPASGSAQLIFPGNNSKCIRIRNSMGQLIFSSITSENELTIPLKDYPRGIYFIEVANGTALDNRRLIIEN